MSNNKKKKKKKILESHIWQYPEKNMVYKKKKLNICGGWEKILMIK